MKTILLINSCSKKKKKKHLSELVRMVTADRTLWNKHIKKCGIVQVRCVEEKNICYGTSVVYEEKCTLQNKCGACKKKKNFAE